MKKKKQLDLVADISYLISWFAEDVSIEKVLARATTVIAAHMNASICTIYLYDHNTEILSLKGASGLRTDKVNSVHFRLGEGLIGFVMQEMRPLIAEEASKHTNFKKVSGMYEKHYDAYLAVPILKNKRRIGVCAVQRNVRIPFTVIDKDMLAVIAAQLVFVIESVRQVTTVYTQKKDSANTKQQNEKLTIRIAAKRASPGYGDGKSLIFDHRKINQLFSLFSLKKKYTSVQFEQAVLQSKKQLIVLQKEVELSLSEAGGSIFGGHLQILDDPAYIGKIRDLIKSGITPPEAVLKVTLEIIQKFSKFKAILIREKAQDVEDIGCRILNNLLIHKKDASIFKNKIIIAEALFPSDLLIMAGEKTNGIILLEGGITSHIAILAQSLNIPMVISTDPRLFEIADGTDIILNAESGTIFVHPDARTRAKQSGIHTAESSHLPRILNKTMTADGVHVNIYTNINLLSEIPGALSLPSRGIGLYRTEFPFIIRNDFPTEEDQYTIFRKLTAAMPDKVITFRTLDIGGDKNIGGLEEGREQNPFLGLRSLRFTLRHMDIFTQQIRAILRAGEGHSQIRIMFPMVSSIEEFEAARDLIHRCSKELAEQGIRHLEQPQLGIMIEIPSIIPLLESFSGMCSFFSIGTNDLVQYLLAVDRTNEKVAGLFMPHHPSVLRSLAEIFWRSEAAGIEVSICGEMANDAHYLPLLIGMGYRNFSINPRFFPLVQHTIKSINCETSRNLTSNILTMTRTSDIEKALGI